MFLIMTVLPYCGDDLNTGAYVHASQNDNSTGLNLVLNLPIIEQGCFTSGILYWISSLSQNILQHWILSNTPRIA